MEEELKHHPRGMSRWPAMLECGCFEGAGDSADAQMGTSVHAYLAGLLDAYKEYGTLPACKEDASMFEAGAYRVAKLIRDCMVLRYVDHGDLHVEDRVTLENGVFGTADAWFQAGDTLIVWDFKSAYHPGRDHMPQLAGYALAIRQQMELNGVKHLPCEFVLRVVYGDSKDVTEEVYDVYELQSVYEKAMAAFDGVATAQPKQCNWCEICVKFTACPACTAVASKVQETLADAPVKWKTYTPAKKAQVMLLAEFLGKWSDDVKKAAKQTLLDGGAVADEAIGAAWTLVTKRGALEVNTAAARKALLEKGVSVRKIRKELKLSTTSFKALLKTVGIKGKAADEIMEACGTRGADSAQIKSV